ncbi:MAG: YqjF family protein [Verrucomicrobiota bacterium]
MAMTWEALLFAHWRVEADRLRRWLPRGLELDLFEGAAWVGVVPFRMRSTRLRGLPPMPGSGTFPELNLRTYVTRGGRPGVWFFSLDAASWLAVRVARRVFHLPYFDARMSLEAEEGGWRYRSRRIHRGAAPARWEGWYRPLGEVQAARPGSLEHWLTERYCLYAADPRGGLWRGEIHHAPWPLQRAEARLERNTLGEEWDLPLPGVPERAHFARRLEVVAWAPGRA